MKKGRVRTNAPQGNPTKSWNDLGIPSDRVAPGAPNPPPALGELNLRTIKKSKSKMRHKQY